MRRTACLAAILALVTAGCAATNPVGPSQFETKLLNLYSIGSQTGSMLNYTPNSQTNLAGQYLISQHVANYPIASLVGAGAATAVNTTGQSIVNNVLQNQNQSQLVL